MLLCLWLLAMNSFKTAENNHKFNIFYKLYMLNVVNAYMGGDGHPSICILHLYTNLFSSLFTKNVKEKSRFTFFHKTPLA
jgi:hypothetical protein